MNTTPPTMNTTLKHKRARIRNRPPPGSGSSLPPSPAVIQARLDLDKERHALMLIAAKRKLAERAVIATERAVAAADIKRQRQADSRQDEAANAQRDATALNQSGILATVRASHLRRVIGADGKTLGIVPVKSHAMRIPP